MEQYPQSTLMYRRVLPKTEAIAYTRRKRPAKQPCFDSEGEPHSPVERGGGGGGGGQGVSYPGPRGKRGAPRSLRKNLFDNFSILTANVNPFHVSC